MERGIYMDSKKIQVMDRLEKLLEKDCCVAFSGGVDSSLCFLWPVRLPEERERKFLESCW